MGGKLLELPTIAIFIAYLFMISNEYSNIAAAVKVQCLDSEQKALQDFKEGFHNPFDQFSSRVPGSDCCKWKGVSCSNDTGHVIGLDLHSLLDSSELLQGELNPSLLDLPYLSYLNLSFIDFRQIQIPKFLGSLSNLKYLDLSNANFKGTIPDELGNFSSLVFLDLSGNGYSLRANDLNWLYNLSSLKFLDLSGVDLSSSVNWLDAINSLSFLVKLRLSACKLYSLPHSQPHVNLTFLKFLDLSFNTLNDSILNWVFEIGHSLVYLNLRRNYLHGLIPEAFGNMSCLDVLDLSDNNLEGPLPTTLGMIQGLNDSGEYSSLRVLNISHNQLNGTLHKILPGLSKWHVLDFSWNELEGVITDSLLLNFSNLRVLDFSGNLLALNGSSDWVPPFLLLRIGLKSCQLGPQFPLWLRTQNNLSSIDISSSGISDVIPDWFWNLSPDVQYVNLSFNNLTGIVPDLSSKLKLSAIDLSSNRLSGHLPLLSPNMAVVILNNNSFSGPIFHLCEMMKVNNSLRYLDLSENVLSGQIPDCWTHGKNLMILNLASNSLSGEIPMSIGNLLQLKTLRLEDNSLSGEIPSSLKNCTGLFVLDLGRNRLSGKISEWIGDNLLNLMILRLSSNQFRGHIPLQLCRLKSLKILDLSSNYLSGEIPHCVDNLKAMVEMDCVRSYIYDPYTTYKEHLFLNIKGLVILFLRVHPILKFFDLSSNNLSGKIPLEITSLVGLLSLNLSNNNLIGNIPPGIGAMLNMESVDLSRNQLSCSIPPSMSNLFFLEMLNLSYNRLSGEIPSVKQFRTFDASSYLGNHNLCGPPLAKNCSKESTYEDTNCMEAGRNVKNMEAESGNEIEIPGFYISMGLGYIAGFWGFWAPLLMKTSWRHSYFSFVSRMIDQIYVWVVVAVARLQRRFGCPQEQK